MTYRERGIRAACPRSLPHLADRAVEAGLSVQQARQYYLRELDMMPRTLDELSNDELRDALCGDQR